MLPAARANGSTLAGMSRPTGVLLVAAAYGRRALAAGLAIGTRGSLLLACLLAGPVPSRLGEFTVSR